MSSLSFPSTSVFLTLGSALHLHRHCSRHWPMPWCPDREFFAYNPFPAVPGGLGHSWSLESAALSSAACASVVSSSAFKLSLFTGFACKRIINIQQLFCICLLSSEIIFSAASLWAFLETRDKDQWSPLSPLLTTRSEEWHRHEITEPPRWRFSPTTRKKLPHPGPGLDPGWNFIFFSHGLLVLLWANPCGKVNLVNTEVGSGVPTGTKGFEKVAICKRRGGWGQGREKQDLPEKRGDFMCAWGNVNCSVSEMTNEPKEMCCFL